jgi:hypothetical protein
MVRSRPTSFIHFEETIMVSLIDVGELSETVNIRGVEVPVTGISGRGLLGLLEKFPEVRKLFAARADEVDDTAWAKLAPDALASVIAAGTGTPGDEAAIEVANGLPVSVQLELIEAILRLTFPDGLGPFVERMTSLAERTAKEVQPTPEAVAASGRAPGMRLPAQSKPS